MSDYRFCIRTIRSQVIYQYCKKQMLYCAHNIVFFLYGSRFCPRQQPGSYCCGMFLHLQCDVSCKWAFNTRGGVNTYDPKKRNFKNHNSICKKVHPMTTVKCCIMQSFLTIFSFAHFFSAGTAFPETLHASWQLSCHLFLLSTP